MVAGGHTAISSIAFGAVEGDGSPNAGVRHVYTRMPSERTRGVAVVLGLCFAGPLRGKSKIFVEVRMCF